MRYWLFNSCLLLVSIVIQFNSLLVSTVIFRFYPHFKFNGCCSNLRYNPLGSLLSKFNSIQ